MTVVRLARKDHDHNYRKGIGSEAPTVTGPKLTVSSAMGSQGAAEIDQEPIEPVKSLAKAREFALHTQIRNLDMARRN